MAFPFCLYLASKLPRFINSMVTIINSSLVTHCWSRSDYALDRDKWVIGAWPDVSLRRSYELYGNDMSHSPVHWVPRQVSHVKLLILPEYMNSPRYLIGNILLLVKFCACSPSLLFVFATSIFLVTCLTLYVDKGGLFNHVYKAVSSAFHNCFNVNYFHVFIEIDQSLKLPYEWVIVVYTKWAISHICHIARTNYFLATLWWRYLFYTRPTRWSIFLIVLAHWNNYPLVNMSLQSGTLSRLRTNKIVFLPFNAAWLSEKKKMLIFFSLVLLVQGSKTRGRAWYPNTTQMWVILPM